MNNPYVVQLCLLQWYYFPGWLGGENGNKAISASIGVEVELSWGRAWQNEEELKNGQDFRNENKLKYKEDLKNENDPKPAGELKDIGNSI